MIFHYARWFYQHNIDNSSLLTIWILLTISMVSDISMLLGILILIVGCDFAVASFNSVISAFNCSMVFTKKLCAVCLCRFNEKFRVNFFLHISHSTFGGSLSVVDGSYIYSFL